jgi:hypothetical protein
MSQSSMDLIIQKKVGFLSASWLSRMGFLLLLFEFPLQFAIRSIFLLPKVFVVASDLFVLGLLTLQIVYAAQPKYRLRLFAVPAIFLLLLDICISILFNDVILNNAINTIRLIFISPALAILVMNLKADDIYWSKVNRVIFFTLILQAAIVTFQFLSSGLNNPDAGQGSFGTNSANSLGDIFAIGVAVLGQRVILKRESIWSYLSLVAISLGLILTSSRLALVILALAAGFLIIRQRRFRLRTYFVGGIVGLLLLLLVFWYYNNTSSGLSLLSLRREIAVATVTGYGANAPPRILMPAWTWQNMKALSPNPDIVAAIIGLGPGMFGSFASTNSFTPFRELIVEQFRLWVIMPGTPPGLYSSYLSLFGELGILGLIAFIWIFIVLWKKTNHAYSKADDIFWKSIAMGGITAILVLLIRGVTANVFEDRIVGFYAWIYIGLTFRILFRQPSGAAVKNTILLYSNKQD